jgi:type III restriction enzyme
MTVKIKFDGNQDFQSEAISSVVDLFEGWSADYAKYETENAYVEDEDSLLAQSLFVNPWGVDQEALLENVKLIQQRTRTDRVGRVKDVIPEEMRLTHAPADPLMDFSIEMETGTGKTYVYLKTAIELYQKYKIKKFIIVVPSIAIREGVLGSLRLMEQHFKDLYPEVQYDSYVYASKNLTKLRQFATSSHLQIMVMNIQSFNSSDNVIVRDNENMHDRPPIDFITAVKPVVIMDEPQRLNGPTHKKAIQSLNPLLRLRYSATHKEKHCLLYRLSPVDAYEMRLVKQIEVLSLSAEDDGASAYVEVVKITSTPSNVKASIRVNMPHAPKTNKMVVRNSKLTELTQSDIYKGWDVEEIVPGTEDSVGYVQFSNGRRLSVNETNDTDKEWWQRAQIQAAVEAHMRTELRLQSRAKSGEIKPTKPLTLFFVDKVANYYPSDGKFRIWFEEIYEQVLKDREFRNLDFVNQKLPAASVHAGYFSVTNKGEAKDTSGDTVDDKTAYDLIMGKKEQLLSFDEPVRFIFSHSALQEGWDNPNVFTICSLQENAKKDDTRRQQLGRGLRLPVMADGERCKVDEVNVLTVVASESFETFASKLQSEFEDETGEKFGAGRIKDARLRKKLQIRNEVLQSEEFKKLWSQISPKTHYKLEFTTDDIVAEAENRLRKLIQAEPVNSPRVVKSITKLRMKAGEDLGASGNSISKDLYVDRKISIPDILTDLARQLTLARSTIYRVIKESETEHLVRLNPASYVDRVKRACMQALGHTLKDKDGIHYYPAGQVWEAKLFSESSIPESYSDNLIATNKSVFTEVPCDSQVEKNFAMALEADDSVKLFLKLPSWFKVPTPLGNYNPDWAVVRQEEGEQYLYLIRETKGVDDPDELFREAEKWKVAFGKKHFNAINVDYSVTKAWISENI